MRNHTNGNRPDQNQDDDERRHHPQRGQRGYGERERYGLSHDQERFGSQYGSSYSPTSASQWGDYGQSGRYGIERDDQGFDRERFGQDARYRGERDWRGRDRGAENWLERAYHRVKEWIGKGPKGYTRSDDRIREDVSDKLSDGYLDASDIEVTVLSGEVTLQGTVHDKLAKRLAEDIAEDVRGVKDVHNHLTIRR